MTGSWNGQPCAVPVAGAARPGGGGGRGRGGRGETTPEQQAAQQEQADKLKAWRTSVSMDAFKKLRKMYNDAGVTIYAWKQLSANMSDAEFEYIFNVAEALGCTHTTLELLTDEAQLKRVGDFAMKKKVYAAYHTHGQGSMTAFDQAFALSKGNMANVDFGHWVAAGNVGGTPMQFLEKHHARISSFHLKDRTTPANCALNLPWGTGETPIKEILQLVRKNKWKIPASIELEYDIPEGSDAVKETKKCVEYCRTALTVKGSGAQETETGQQRLRPERGSKSGRARAGSGGGAPPATDKCRQSAVMGPARQAAGAFTNLSHPPQPIRDTVRGPCSESSRAPSC